MTISQTQASQLSMHQSKKFAQDKTVPMLINIKDGRLIANSLNVRANPDYRPYGGRLDASLQERLAYIASSVGSSRTRVINSAPEAATFDLGKATKAEIITFAMEEYGMVLSDETDVRTLRKQVLAAAGEPVTDLS